jgi:hypothetical protein
MPTSADPPVPIFCEQFAGNGIIWYKKGKRTREYAYRGDKSSLKIGPKIIPPLFWKLSLSPSHEMPILALTHLFTFVFVLLLILFRLSLKFLYYFSILPFLLHFAPINTRGTKASTQYSVPSQVATHAQRLAEIVVSWGWSRFPPLGLLICSQVRYHWAASPPLSMKTSCLSFY